MDLTPLQVSEQAQGGTSRELTDGGTQAKGRLQSWLHCRLALWGPGFAPTIPCLDSFPLEQLGPGQPSPSDCTCPALRIHSFNTVMDLTGSPLFPEEHISLCFLLGGQGLHKSSAGCGGSPIQQPKEARHSHETAGSLVFRSSWCCKGSWESAIWQRVNSQLFSPEFEGVPVS